MRRPIETAPRRVTSSPGNSSPASAEAEYTEAPASLTMVYGTPKPCSRMSSATNSSASRDPVPLPIAMALTTCSRMRPSNRRAAADLSFCGGVK
ncbi:MAG: hypothetical protein DDT36_01575 [Firmicutes bacterium]|nr:hypothetical protein [Bacillota bacterium]